METHVERLGVVSGPPIRWVKAFAIQKALSSHEAVVYLDYDITVRPDCLGAARLIQDLFSSSSSESAPTLWYETALLAQTA